ncbi:MAG: PilZ domain-containing protein [Sphingomicrobium sp.]
MDAAGGPDFSNVDNAPADRSERRLVSLRGYVILADNSHHPVQVLDLSYEGCGIETIAPLEPAQQLKLSVLQRGAIDAVVRWSRNGKAGLAFTQPASEAKKHWPRRSERIELVADVCLRRVGRSTFRVAVTNASPEGCKVQLVERPSEGERVVVKFEGLEPLESKVAWIDNFTAGLRYSRPMHPAVFELLVERLKN